MDRFILIRSTRFPVLPGEKDELVNEGTYGKAQAGYLHEKLKERGYDVPFICCEDWGWWVELRAPLTYWRLRLLRTSGQSRQICLLL